MSWADTCLEFRVYAVLGRLKAELRTTLAPGSFGRTAQPMSTVAALPSDSPPPPQASPLPDHMVEISLEEKLVHIYDNRETE
jgi:hypothetical protein